MIKAIVVDDERLVRKGFISLIDWPSFGVVIVGEAGDGASALALLEEREADLLFVDITMPGMSGFDLIRQVRLRFPGTRCVVLTCHHEFDYVQEALRLGAVDYIVKTLLEVENAGETIGRLVERIKWEDNARELLNGAGETKTLNADQALVMIPSLPPGNEGDLLRLSAVKNNRLIALDGMWITPLIKLPGSEERRELQRLDGRWQAALVSGLRGRRLQEIGDTLTYALGHALFYAGNDAEPAVLGYKELQRMRGEGQPYREQEELLGHAHNLRWTVDRAQWEKLAEEVEQLRPSAEQIRSFGFSLLASWQGYLLDSGEAALLEEAAVAAVYWCHWNLWLRRFAGHVQRRMLELGMSKEVLLCLIRAVRYMRSHAGDKINQGDVAAYVNMSRGYFSQCFARFAGESFGECLRGMRLTLAKSLLLTTNAPVSEIACRSGFEDDRYFSRLFREHVGRLPSEYRAEGSGQ